MKVLTEEEVSPYLEWVTRPDTIRFIEKACAASLLNSPGISFMSPTGEQALYCGGWRSGFDALKSALYNLDLPNRNKIVAASLEDLKPDYGAAEIIRKGQLHDD